MATKRSTTHPDRTSDSPEHEPDPQRPQLDIPSHHQGNYGVVAMTEGMASLGLQLTAGGPSSGEFSYWSDQQVLEAERELFSDTSGSHVAHFQHLSGDHQQAGASGYQHLYGNYQQGQGSGYQHQYGNFQQAEGSGYQQHYGDYQQGQGSGYQHLYVGPGQVYGDLPSQQSNANPLEIAGPSSTPGIAALTQLSLGAASAGGSRANPGQNGESPLMAPVPNLQYMDPAHSEGDTVEHVETSGFRCPTKGCVRNRFPCANIYEYDRHIAKNKHFMGWIYCCPDEACVRLGAAQVLQTINGLQKHMNRVHGITMTLAQCREFVREEEVEE